MRCPNCKSEVKEGSPYCDRCGTTFLKSSLPRDYPSDYTKLIILSRLERGNKFSKLGVHGSALDEYMLVYNHYQTYVNQFKKESRDLADFLYPEDLFNDIAIDSLRTVYIEGAALFNSRRDEVIELLKFAKREDLIDGVKKKSFKDKLLGR